MTKQYTVKQVAAYLQLHWQTILKYIKSGILPAAKLGREYRVSEKDLLTFIKRAKGQR